MINNVKLSPIVVPKSSDVLARELRRRILSGAVPAGSALPTERELVSQTGLSRTSVREALRLLEAENLVTTRPGRYGGSIASQPDDNALGRYISTFVHGRAISLMSLLQCREAIGPSMAALAAENRTDDELQQLKRATERVEEQLPDLPAFLRENVEWQCVLAAASHNELLRAFILSISSMIHKASAIENFATEDVRKQVIQAHRRIFNAIEAKDADAARRRMARHLAAITAACRELPAAPLVLDY